MADDIPSVYHDLSYTGLKLLDRVVLRLGLSRASLAGVWHYFKCWLSGPAHGPDQPNNWSGRRESNPHDQLGRQRPALA